MLAEFLTPVLRDALRSEFDHLRRNYQQADLLLKEELETAIASARAEAAKEIETLKARVKELEATKWWVTVSYGAVVAFVTALWHLGNKVPWKRLQGIFGSG